MILGRMVYNFTDSASIARIHAWRLSLLFVLLDVVAFFVQAGGASLASSGSQTSDGQTPNPKLITTGLDVYMAGCGFQQACILVFLWLAVRLRKEISKLADKKAAMHLLITEFVVVALISVRIIFRLVEYSRGIDSTIPQHEAYQYVFDSTLMLIALVLFNVYHPGRMMPGKEADLPSKKQRKEAKRIQEKISGRAETYV